MPPKPLKKRVGEWGALAIAVPLIGCIFCLKFAVDAAADALDAGSLFYDKCKIRYRVKTYRLRKSKPLATAPLSKTKTKTGKSAASPSAHEKTGFLDLPPEIRQQIYRLALPGPAIIQPRVHSSFWGPRPPTWVPTQGIRTDADPPSEALRLITGLGGSSVKQLVAPPTRGCVHYGSVSLLICGDMHHFAPRWVRPHEHVFHTDLMRSCRAVYADVLEVLYAQNTVSLFGADIARYFCRISSPEGLSRVRFVHVALMIPNAWDDKKHKTGIEETIRVLKDSMPSLRQLDIEVALLWGQPKDPRRFWNWLREDVLEQLRGLDRFVLKVSAYLTMARPGWGRGYEAWTPDYEPLASWNDEEYEALKARITSSEEAMRS
ncbi:hypothetical protein GGS26DRAFT_450680 [Hypomontagnella submonticulosa]|nr:hypothetical protein GGS26DRAFT_450680 [Hypomontagnella submonticulosa]